MQKPAAKEFTPLAAGYLLLYFSTCTLRYSSSFYFLLLPFAVTVTVTSFE